MKNLYQDMTKKENNLKQYFKETYPHLLELYKFLYDIRVKEINNKFNSLILIISVLFLTFFEILKLMNYNKLFYIPIIFLFSSLSPIFFTIFSRKIWFHWFEKQDYKNFFHDKKNFFEMGFRDIFGSIPHIVAYESFSKKLYLVSINLLLISLGSLAVLISYHLFGFNMALNIELLLFEFLILINFFRKEEFIKNPSEEVEDFFNKFMEKNKNTKI